MYSDMEQYPGNFSNVYKKGTKYYSIKGINTEESIAIHDINGKYKKADRGEEYTFGATTEEVSFGISDEKYNYLLGSAIILAILFLF
ncbi:hypothetical protein [Robertmurraya korlensis]|uniref:hypothetical protein n=1 Tax=Robertmurraya korlensis TaxID=519977 RepID=UPI0012EE2D63|nr:hypothetical protein [Robertmurraya korlensis]